jgi:hypothetical protein
MLSGKPGMDPAPKIKQAWMAAGLRSVANVRVQGGEHPIEVEVRLGTNLNVALSRCLGVKLLQHLVA